MTKKSPSWEGLHFRLSHPLNTVVHLELNGMRCHIENFDLFRFQLNVGIDRGVGENVALPQEFTVVVQGVQCLLQRRADCW